MFFNTFVYVEVDVDVAQIMWCMDAVLCVRLSLVFCIISKGHPKNIYKDEKLHIKFNKWWMIVHEILFYDNLVCLICPEIEVVPFYGVSLSPRGCQATSRDPVMLLAVLIVELWRNWSVDLVFCCFPMLPVFVLSEANRLLARALYLQHRQDSYHSSNNLIREGVSLFSKMYTYFFKKYCTFHYLQILTWRTKKCGREEYA